MRITVFGGSGFLGSHVVDSLVEKGHKVVVFDIKPYIYDATHEMIVGDILDEETVDSAVATSDVVYNFAGMASLDDASTKPTDTIKLNILGNCNVMNACVKHKVKRYVYASTFYVHSDKGGFYRCSKQASEIYLEEFNRKYDMKYTILRYGSLYGTRSDKTNGIYRLVRQGITEGKITYPGTGNELREYIHVKDAANLSVEILSDDYINKHIIITGSVPYKTADILSTISDIISKPIEIEFINNEDALHYNVTPYVYKPKYSFKLTSTCYRDIGQGLFECVDQISCEIGKDNLYE